MNSTTTEKRDVYTIVTDRIIELLKQGTVPWKKPWTEAGLPQNLISKRPYRGINVWLLASYNYEQNYFLTFKQLKEINGRVKKDEKAHVVVFWKWMEPGDVNEQSEDNNAYKGPFLRYYTVFNVAQCTGIPENLIPAINRQAYPIPACEEVVKKMPMKPMIKNKENSAYYNPLIDVVNVPKIGSFVNEESYYATLFHELIHSTGHLSRLNRKGLLEMTPFGSEPYSFEELVAEIGACYLESLTGIASTQIEQNAAYISGWLEKFQNDKRFIISASTQAQKATDFILGINQDEREETADKAEVIQ